MDVTEKIDLVTRDPTEEVVTREELVNLFNTNPHPKHYIGLEISGFLHLGSLILTGFKINDFVKAGVKCIVFLADWHTYINNKLGGDWEKIQIVSKYYADAFKLFCPGAEILEGSQLYESRKGYWMDLVKFAKNMSLDRTIRSLTIMGRSEKDKIDLGQLFYPPMQAVDIHTMDLDIVHAGMDQRKIHMLVREIIFHEFSEVNVERPAKFGGNITYASYQDLERDFAQKKLHPSDLKATTAKYVIDIIKPIREKLVLTKEIQEAIKKTM